MASTFYTETINECIARFEQSLQRVNKCLQELTEEDVWHRANENSNSTANLILHICGNMRQYIITGIGGSPDIRERDKEFSANGGLTKTELADLLHITVNEALVVIKNSNEEQLLVTRTVQGNQLNGIAIIIRVAEHFGYHTGQIVFAVKAAKNKDLGFYRGQNLNIKNKQ